MTLVEEFTAATMTNRQKVWVSAFGTWLAVSLYTNGLWILGLAPKDVGSWPYSSSIMLVAGLVSIVLHEGLHGVFFYRFCGQAKFGATWSKLGPVFWASAPGSQLTRRRYQMVGLAPQILTVAIVIVLLTTPLPVGIAYGLLCGAAFNLGGGCMDIYVVKLLRKYPPDYILEDIKDGCRVYAPEVQMKEA